MALIVEDGTVVAGAESYISVADANTYFTAHGAPATWTGAEEVKETALRMATQFLDATYGGRWKGERFDEDQVLDWPRDSVEIDGELVEETPLPTVLKHACAELAHRHLTETGGLMPDVAAEDRQVASEADSVGPISTSKSYVGGKPTTKRFTIVENLLRRILRPTDRMVRI